jgi:hypothetical protein
LETSREIGVEVNTEKTKYMVLVSHTKGRIQIECLQEQSAEDNIWTKRERERERERGWRLEKIA